VFADHRVQQGDPGNTVGQFRLAQRPTVIGRVEGLVHDAGAPGDGGGEAWIASVAADDLEACGLDYPIMPCHRLSQS
jgi:hypothetical protein